MLFLTPSTTPVTEIYLGELVPPIKALKLSYEGETGAFITRTDWIRAKNALEGSVPTCEWAVSEAVASCLEGIERAEDIAQPEIDYTITIQAYQTQLELETERANEAERKNNLFRWVAIGATVLFVSSSTLYYFASQ
jgi:hypothetical protein